MIGIPQFLSHMAYIAHPDRLRKDREADEVRAIEGDQAAPAELDGPRDRARRRETPGDGTRRDIRTAATRTTGSYHHGEGGETP